MSASNDAGYLSFAPLLSHTVVPSERCSLRSLAVLDNTSTGASLSKNSSGMGADGNMADGSVFW